MPVKSPNPSPRSRPPARSTAASARTRAGKVKPAGKTPQIGTRERLVQAAVDVVRNEGMGALTSVRITQVAGIAQPRFYRYFSSVDACLTAAALEVVRGIRDVSIAMRRSMQDTNDPVQLTAHYKELFAAALRDRPFVELARRYGADPSLLGTSIRAAAETAEAAFADDLWQIGHARGLTARDKPRIARLSAMILANVNDSVRIVLSDPNVDQERLAAELADYTIAGTRDGLRRMLRRG